VLESAHVRFARFGAEETRQDSHAFASQLRSTLLDAGFPKPPYPARPQVMRL
jgi:hypothetical protein